MLSPPSTTIDFNTPYDTFLLEHGEHLHNILQDIRACKIETIRKTSVNDMEQILNLFKGSTLVKKREAFMQFLIIMPEYRSTDQEVLYRRLKQLKERIKVTDGTSDLYYWAMRKYKDTSDQSDA